MWHHAPAHFPADRGALMVTAGTFRRRPLLDSAAALDLVTTSLGTLASHHGLNLQAWAVLPNHYHLVAIPDTGTADVSRFVRHLHSVTARGLNLLAGMRGRRVWFQYWDSTITFARSYYARLNYVHYNPARHGLVADACDWRWCSARWLEESAPGRLRRMLLDIPHDRVHVPDDF